LVRPVRHLVEAHRLAQLGQLVATFALVETAPERRRRSVHGRALRLVISQNDTIAA
jgi:hypothetical protein